jgi:GDP-4-dehydro-6-deoxy-D-mannose reductase
MRALVTGVNGFVGKHLVRELGSRGDEVVGIGREASPAPEIEELLADYWVCDLMDKEAVGKLPLEDIGEVISLAGLAGVGDSFSDSDKYKAINVAVLTNLLQTLIDKNLKPRVIAVSTGAVYKPAQPLPLTEDSKLAEVSPYATSKLMMERAVEGFRTKGLEIIIVRPFNHIGPGQEPGFLVPDLYTRIVTAQKTGQPIKVGNLSTRRDYTDVRDVARAYDDLVHAKELKHNLYNICSGKSVSGQEILDKLLVLMGVSVGVEPDPALMRPNDNPDLYGSYQRLHSQTGWQPQIRLEKTLADFVASAS